MSDNLRAIAERLNALTPEKQDAFRKRLADKGIDSWALPIVPFTVPYTLPQAKHINDQSNRQATVWPLSAAQQRLWFIHRFEQGNQLYNLTSGLRLQGKLDVERLQNAFIKLVERHEILRTIYCEYDGVAGQQVLSLDQVSLQLSIVDIESESELELSQQSQELVFSRITQHFHQQGFTLDTSVPFRTQLYRVAENDHLLLISVHHIAFDAWSQELLIRELSLLYSGELQHTALPPLPIQYKDYACWQQQWLVGSEYQRQLDYWRKQLEDCPPYLALPLDKPRPKADQRHHKGAEIRLSISDTLSATVREQARVNGVSVYQYLLTVFNILLQQYTGSEDIILGTSVANRQRSELEPLVGLLVNTLVLRTQIPNTARFNDTLKAVSDTSQRAVANQDIPFDHLIEALDVERSDQYSPLFQVLFVYLAMPQKEALSLGELKVDILPQETDQARFDLSLRVEDQGHFCLCMEYAKDIFLATTIEQMLEDFIWILERVCKTPEICLNSLNLPSAKICKTLSSLDKVIDSVDSTLLGDDKLESSVSENSFFESALAMFHQSVAHQPDEAALYFEASENKTADIWSYQKLNNVADQLSKHFYRCGVRTGERVALCFENSPKLIASIIAVWKLGAAYVAFDPRWPLSRRAELLEDSQVCLLVSEKRLWHEELSRSIPKNNPKTNLKTFYLDNLSSLNIDDLPDSHVNDIEKLSALPAYFIFTSGSTGKPKAVCVTQGNLAGYVKGITEQLDLSTKAQLLSLGSLSADLGHTAVYGALLTGRCLRILDSSISEDPSLLAKSLQSQPVDCLKITPSHLKGLGDVISQVLPREVLVLGGEAFDKALVDQLHEAMSNELGAACRVMNHYGPTETTVGVLSYNFTFDDIIYPCDLTRSENVPLGSPLKKVQTYILNSSLTPVPKGASGELYIGGPAVAQSYWNRAALTAEKFVPDPFSHVPGARMYRTGDQVRLCADNKVEYLGRIDQQIKVRGYRVELGEIEQVLRTQVYIQDAVVLAYVHQQTQQVQLHSFLVLSEKSSIQQQVNHKEVNYKEVNHKQVNHKEVNHKQVNKKQAQKNLDKTLGDVLPEYMIPSHYHYLAQLPRLANGKVDRAVLVDQISTTDNSQQVSGDKNFAAPMSPTEKTLAAIWCNVLVRDEVGIDDNFFALGGDSILSLQVLAQARKKNIVLTPKQFFAGKTIAGMLALIDPVKSAETSKNKENTTQLGNENKSDASANNKQIVATIIRQPRTDQLLTHQPHETDANKHWPLSFSQERLWWLDQYSQGSSHYNIPVALEVEGSLNLDAIQSSLNALITRHEPLRTGFINIDGQGAQVVYKDVAATVGFSDLSASRSDKDSSKSLLDNIIERESQWVFDLSKPPLLRLQVLRFYEQKHVLLFNMHHICTDGWSMKLLIKEFLLAYKSSAEKGIQNPRQQFQQQAHELTWDSLAALPVQYVDYCCWQRQYLSDSQLQTLTQFWQQQLQSTSSALDLPTDRPRPAVQSFRGGRLRLEWPTHLNQAIQKRCRESAKTPFMVLLAVFQYCLRCYSGEKHFCIGIPVNGREHAQTQDLVGFFINTLVLPAHIDDALTIDQFMTQVERCVVNAQAHQAMPFEKLVSLLEQERDLSRSPLFQVMFNLQHAAVNDEQLHAAGISLRSLKISSNTAKYDLTLDLTEHRPAGAQYPHYSGELEYNSDIFDPATIASIGKLFVGLVDLMLGEPKRYLRDLLLADSQHDTNKSINTSAVSCVTPGESIPSSAIPCRITAMETYTQSRQPAVIDDKGVMSHLELHQASDRIANWLHAQGIAEGAVVAVNLQRTRHLLITLLAIAKAGAAYLPLDPSHPISRRLYMLRQAAAKLVVCEKNDVLLSEHNQNLNEKSDQVINNISIERLIAEADSAPLLKNNADERVNKYKKHPQQLAYTIFTSGSTGNPKGVQVSYRALDNFLNSLQKNLELKSSDRLLAVTTVAFDIAALELWLPLTCGACVVLANEEQRRDPDALVALMQSHQVSVMQATPATWRMLMTASQPWPTRSGIKVLCGGEALPIDLARSLLAKEVTLFNVYGPTETTIWSSLAAVDSNLLEAAQPSSTVSLGRPIDNTQCYLLDEWLRPVPQGALGMLYIGGEGLARGYAKRADLTATAFIANPFANDGSRLYCTGDYVRLLPNGQLQYHGRRDGQIKLHGYRIELFEIEACLCRQGVVAEAAVVLNNGELVAYWVAVDGDHTADENKILEDALAQDLPEYMRPRQLIKMDNLPLNSSGKVDRKRLQNLAITRSYSRLDDNSFEAPTDALEQQLADLWCELLKLDNTDREKVGRHDNFFRLGGHSLLASQLVARLRQLPEWQGNFGLRVVFEHPTVAQLAHWHQQQSQEKQELNALPTLGVADSAKPLPLSFQQQRLWLLQRLSTETKMSSTAAGSCESATSNAYNMSALIRLQGDINEDAISYSIDSIVARHTVLRTCFASAVIDGIEEDVQEIKTAASVAIDHITLLGASFDDDVVKQALSTFAEIPFDLAADIPFRVQLLKLANDDHILQLTIHHVASDAWSMAIAQREFAECYCAYINGEKPRLPTLDIQYSDYAHWQRKNWQGKWALEQQAYWRENLAGYSGVQALPLDNERPSVQSYSGDIYSFTIKAEQVVALKSLAHHQGATLFMVLMATFQLLLHKEMACDDVVVGTDVANRPHPSLENLIGFFINVLPIRSKIDSSLAFESFLNNFKNIVLDAFAHQSVPFEQIVEVMQLARIESMSPLVQVLFVMQNLEQESLSLPGLTVTTMNNPHISSRFDMALFIDNDEGVEVGEDLNARWVYRRDLFKPTTIDRLAKAWQFLLEQIIENPSYTINQYRLVDTKQQSTMQTKNKLRKLGKLKKTKAKALHADSQEWVKTSHFSASVSSKTAPLKTTPVKKMPLIISPALEALDPFHWVKTQRDTIESQLQQYGAVLFRGFRLQDAREFEAFAQAICPNLHGSYGDLPKEESGKRIYKSTPYPENQMILYHNESSHMHRWPRLQWFFSQTVAQSGGATPIVDCREVYRKLPKAVVDTFERKHLLYVRNFTPRLDVSWQDYFKTEKRADVEKLCREAGAEFEWFGQQGLQIREHSPAVICHPLTGEKSFFNQIQLHHAACLEADVREDLMSLVGLEGLPRHVYYGDGTPIDDSTVQQILATYESLAIRFDWQQGDVLMVDNMLVAHARDPFEGPRKIAVAMAELQARKEVFSAPHTVSKPLTTA